MSMSKKRGLLSMVFGAVAGAIVGGAVAGVLTVSFGEAVSLAALGAAYGVVLVAACSLMTAKKMIQPPAPVPKKTILLPADMPF